MRMLHDLPTLSPSRLRPSRTRTPQTRLPATRRDAKNDIRPGTARNRANAIRPANIGKSGDVKHAGPVGKRFRIATGLSRHSAKRDGGARRLIRPTDIVRQILIHAEVFKRFSPKSFLELCGIDIAEARAHCAHLVKLGKIERLPDLDDCWYRGIREFRPASTPTPRVTH